MNDPKEPVRVVGMGASAGGLEALERFFERADTEMAVAYVVVQHLSPDHKSLMADILGKRTRLPVTEAEDGVVLEPGRVYVVPARKNLVVEGRFLRLKERAAAHTLNLPIDLLFRSLAEQQGELAMGVVLSGTGSDGRMGIEAIKEAGGLVIAQDPSTARFDGMPLSAISTGLVDLILAPDAMPAEIRRHVEGVLVGKSRQPPISEEALGRILEVLKRVSGIDFREYKPNTVLRRIERRMALLRVPVIEEYALRVEHDAAEATALSRELLINVTRFFRDEEAFAALRTPLSEAVARTAPKDQLRVWVAGCATGQEAYTVAMLLTEIANELSVRLDFKIFATDVDTEALEVASQGRYTEAQVIDITPERLARYFTRTEDGWLVDRELRRKIVFAPHNVGRDPPFTRLDLVSCRNVLIYLSPPLQRRVLASFAFGLRGDGILFLGTSESLGDVSDRFQVIDGHWKIFRRLPGSRGVLTELAPAATHVARLTSPEPQSETQLANETGLRLLMERVAPTSLLATDTLDLVSVFGNAAQLLRVPMGQATLNVLAMLPPSIQTIASMAAHRALSSNQESTFAVSDVATTGVNAIRVLPFTLPRGGRRYLLIAFERSTIPSGADMPALTDEAQRQVGELQQELAFVRESLQATIEELETSNEELQATNEELLAANEELQSTNEELQSVNEELNSVNVEHQAKIKELTELNTDLDNLFKSTHIGTLFLDQDLLIRRFTPAITAQFNVLERDVGRPIQHISSNLVGNDPSEEVRRVLETGAHVEREVSTSTGRRFLMRMFPYLTDARQIRGVVLTFVDLTETRTAQLERRLLQSVIDSLIEHIAVLDAQGHIRMVNASWRRFAENNGGSMESGLGPGTSYLDACAATPDVKAALEELLAGRRRSFSHEYPCHSPTEKRWFLLHASPLVEEGGVVVSHIDITRRKVLEGAPA